MKPENILIDAEGHLKLVDFGFAKKIESSKLPDYVLIDTMADSDQERRTRFAGHQSIWPLK